MTYEELLDLLREKVSQNGKASATVGRDVVVLMSAEYLRALLSKAEESPDATAAIVVLYNEQALLKDKPN